MTDTTKLNHGDLLERIQAGDEDAFATLYRHFQGPIYRFAFHMTASRSIAEEVTQEVFLTVMRGDAKYDPNRGAVSALLFGIARNHVLRSLDKGRSHMKVDMEESARSLTASSNPLEDVVRGEAIESVRQAILGLPAVYREIVVLCDLQEMSYAEASEVLGCAVGTVRSRLSRARALLAKKLGLRSGAKRERCSV